MHMGPTSSALLLPETEPSAYNIASLLFFFESMSFYLPTESDTAGKSLVNLFGNLCKAYVPAPLDEDLARFNRLLREMETSRPDELTRLFSAAKQPMATGQIRDKDEISSDSVFSVLHSKTEMKISAEHKERLWQARLILKLAEILDRRETEVRQGLARVALSEQRVFASLEGISDMDTDDLAELAELNKPKLAPGTKSGLAELTMDASVLLTPLRVKAWAELFLADTTPHRPPVIVAANAECGSILLDNCGDTWGLSPVKLFTLYLPTFPGLAAEKSAANDYMKCRNKLRAAAIVQLEYFENFFNESAAYAQPLPGNHIAILGEYADSWNNTVKTGLPAITRELKTLDFYRLPGISLTSLFQKLYHLGPVHAAARKDHPSTILAILQD